MQATTFAAYADDSCWMLDAVSPCTKMLKRFAWGQLLSFDAG
jgi:hypothetical protein